MQIHPKDQIIIKNLAALEEAGEQGFSTYHAGNTEVGSQQMKQSLNESAQNINSIRDPELRKQAKQLLNATNSAIREYIKNPTDDNLSVLKTDVYAYKEFLDQHQS